MSDVVHPPECVYNSLMRPEVHPPKPPRYISKFKPVVILEENLKKDAMRTMGPAKVEVPSPDQYTKKHSGELRLSTKSQSTNHRTCSTKKAPVPARTDVPAMHIHTKRNFLTTTTALVPVKPQPACVDTKQGHRQLLEGSGLVPKYINKKDYGEVPEYLLQRKERHQKAQEEYYNYVREKKEHGPMKQMSHEERQAVLEGLKKNWDKVYHDYQALSLVTDTLSKKAHKEQLETAMKELEGDIQLFEKFQTIYIPNHQDPNVY